MEDNELKMTPEEIKGVRAEIGGLPSEPQSPYMIYMMASFKDFVDLISGGFLAFFTSIIFGIVIWFWMLGKVGFIQKRLVRWGLRRFVIGLLVKSIPIIAMIPIATILVYLAHNHEKKLVQSLFRALEQAEKVFV